MPLSASAGGLDAEDAAGNVRALESSQNRAIDAMAVVSARQKDNVQAAEGAASTFWVIADLVKGPARKSVWLVTGILRQVFQGRIATAAQAKLRRLRRRLRRLHAPTRSFLATQDHLKRECPFSNVLELS